MIEYQHNDFKIVVIDEPSYKINSSENNFNYSKQYFGEEATVFPTSKHAVKIFRNDQIVDSCIVIGSGGATGVHKNSSLLDDDELLLCCCDTIFCLKIPNLELKWKTKSDIATCFQIFKHQDEYLIHGELQITKIDKDGNIKWEFGGKDIFVSLDNEKEFVIEDDGILLTDFSNNKYKIDFEGKLI